MIKGYKAFDKNFQCRGFQFGENQSYTEPDAEICKRGFHFCENPLDLFQYYAPSNSRFAEVEGKGKTDKHGDDSKIACTELHIKTEISLSAILGAGIKFILDRVDWKNNKESNTGYRSAATNTGDRSAATNTGDRSAATVEGKDSVACGLGYACKARGAKGCWIVLAERDENYKIISVKATLVDGKKIKENTFYELRKGKFCEEK